jgi:DNA polymerase-3 subunit delta
MLLFLYGKETYQLQKKLREIRDKYQKKYGSNLSIEDKDAFLITVQDLSDLFFQKSFFAKKKLIFLDNLFLNEKFKSEFLKELDRFAQAEDLLVLIQKGSIPDKKSLTLLERAGKVQEFKPFKKGKMKSWLKDESQKLGLSFSDEAITLLLDSFGDDLWRLSNEIRKIALFKKDIGANQIQSKDVRSLINPDLEDNVFKTIDALAKKQRKQALRLIQENLLKKDKPLSILSMIAFQFRGLLLAKAFQSRGGSLNDFISSGFLKPFPARKCWYASNNFSQEQLKKAYQKIFEIDLSIKQGRLDQEEALKMFVAEI